MQEEPQAFCVGPAAATLRLLGFGWLGVGNCEVATVASSAGLGKVDRVQYETEEGRWLSSIHQELLEHSP